MIFDAYSAAWYTPQLFPPILAGIISPTLGPRTVGPLHTLPDLIGRAGWPTGSKQG